jgi:arginase
MPPREIAVLGVPTNSAGTTDGVARAPEALREAGLLGALRASVPAVDDGDVPLPAPRAERDRSTHVIDPEGLKAMTAAVRERVAAILGDGRFPLVLGGDCPVLLGCLAAFGIGERHGLLFVDGHEDAYPPERSTTGEAADMELGLALGVADLSWWPELAALSPLVMAARTRLLGPRDRAAILREGVDPVSERVATVDAAGVAADPDGAASAAVRAVATGPWWLHVDLDVLSTEALPAVDYPQPGGLSWEQLERVTAEALPAGPVGWDVTIYNPDLDPDRTSAERIVRFLAAAVRAIPGRA